MKESNSKEKAIKKNKLADGKGLYLIIKPNGSKLWRFDFRYGNKNLSMSFGVYPDVTLKEAREKREEARELLLKNINPISAKRIKRSSESITLSMIIDEWLKLRAKSSSVATVTQNRRMLNNITNWLGNIAIKDVRRVDIINVLEKIQTKGVIETAHRILSLMNKIYMFAVTKEYIEHNIIADIDKKSVLIPSNKNIHHPAITSPVKAAFKSLWDTVQKGEVWTGYVKNATKDGGYYWVFATVYPFESCDGSKGYLSCRRKPSKIEIEKAEKLYEQMRRDER